MRHVLFLSALVCLFFACNNANDGNQTGDNTMDNQEGMAETTANAGSWDQNRTNEFVQTVASSGMMEVELGRMAAEKGTSQEVKNFGQQMVQDHSNANQQLQSVVQGMQMSVPQTMMDKHQQIVNDLQGLSGNDFDRKYIDMMVDAHMQDIQKFKDAQGNVSNQQLNNWINNTLPVLQQHYDHVQQIDQQQDMNN